MRVNVPGSSYGGLVFDHSGWGNATTLRPNDDWYGCLGTSNEQFNLLYIDHVIARVVSETSDESLKENINALDNSLGKIEQLSGVSFDFKPEYFDVLDEKMKAGLEKSGKNQIGFIAQELMEIIPESVFYDSTSNLYSIRYTSLLPVLVEAMKEQQTEIEELRAQLASIEENCCGNNLKSASIGSGANSLFDEIKAQLDQNIPNPFNKTTKINCVIPPESNNVNLYIYNMQGTQLQQHKINGTGEQCVTFSAGSLKAGMYLYTLIADGKEVDTKKMFLTK
jgi:hypothetical protein